MKEELKSGIQEFDLTIEQYERGEIDLIKLSSKLWNGGYSAGEKESQPSELLEALKGMSEWFTLEVWQLNDGQIKALNNAKSLIEKHQQGA